MDRRSMKFAGKYVARIEAQEVALIAASDLGYWSDRLRCEQLFPVRPARAPDRAELMISAIASRWMAWPLMASR